MNRLARLGLVVVCAMSGVSTVTAQDADPLKSAVETRQSLLKLINWSFAPVGLMLKNKVPVDAAAAQKSAARLKQLATFLPDVFAVDTHKATASTKAREGIWTNLSDFASKADDLQKAAAALEEAARGGDKAATITAARAVGVTCGGCHKAYKDD
jgi:cytochrome c556